MNDRILLLEAVHPNPEHHRGVEFYPFLLSLFRSLGLDARWWVTSVPRTFVQRGQAYALDLQGDQATRVVQEVAAWRPDLVLANDVPSEGLRAALLSAAPGVRIVPLAGRVTFVSTVADALAILAGHRTAGGPDVDADRPLLQAVPPSFDRRFFDPALETAPVQFHRLAIRYDCQYRRPATRNRFYHVLDPAVVRRNQGCAFCYLPIPDVAAGRKRPALDLELDLALAQIRAHQEAAAAQVRTFEYQVDQSRVGENVDRLLEKLLDGGLRPSRFTAMQRVDSVLAGRERYEALLPRMAAAGHHLRLVSIGADNLSDDENERFNKGITGSQIIACQDLLDDLSARFPAAFSSSRMSWILFTPWTRPEDLRVNLSVAERMGQVWVRAILGTMLQLWEGSLVTALARHDGLACERFGSVADIAMSSVPAGEVHEVPWRFQDPRVERIHALLIRLEPLPDQARIPADDPLLAEVRAARAVLPPDRCPDWYGLLRGVVDAVEALGADAPVPEVFRFIADKGVKGSR